MYIYIYIHTHFIYIYIYTYPLLNSNPNECTYLEHYLQIMAKYLAQVGAQHILVP